MATTTRSQSANAKPSPRAQSKQRTTASPVKKTRAPAGKRRASPRNNVKTESRAQSHEVISIHGSDSDVTPTRAAPPSAQARAPRGPTRAPPSPARAPSTPASAPPTPAPKILTVTHPQHRLLVCRLARLPATHQRLHIRQRRDLATHLPALTSPTAPRIKLLEEQVGKLQERCDDMAVGWMGELGKAIRGEERDFRREVREMREEMREEVLRGVWVEGELMDLRYEMWLRGAMTYE